MNHSGEISTRFLPRIFGFIEGLVGTGDQALDVISFSEQGGTAAGGEAIYLRVASRLNRRPEFLCQYRDAIQPGLRQFQ